MTRVRRRQLLSVAIVGATCWVFFSLYMVVHVGLPRGKDIVQLSKLALPAYDDDNSTRSRLLKFLLTLRSSPHVKLKLNGSINEHKTVESFKLNISSKNTFVMLTRSAQIIQPKDEEFENKWNHGNNNLSTSELSNWARLLRANLDFNDTKNEDNEDKYKSLFNDTQNEDNEHRYEKYITKQSVPHTDVKGVDNHDLVQLNDADAGVQIIIANSRRQYQYTEGWHKEGDARADTHPTNNNTYNDKINVDYINTSYRASIVQQVTEIRTEAAHTLNTQVSENRQHAPGQLNTQSQESQLKQQLVEDKLVLIKDINVRNLSFDPDDPGEDGDPVLSVSDERPPVEQSWKDYSFNDYVSGKISLERSLPDPRNSMCLRKTYGYSTLPKTTVIMCFTDESWSVLLRSVHSVVNRTPPELLHEILLVDDFSQRPHLHKPLDDYIAANFRSKVRIIRLPHRHGLIRARLVAVDQTTTEVMTFLDSHIECNVGWLEPQLAAIAADRRTVVSPVIDTLQSDTFQYVPTADDLRGGFSWNMQFVWHIVPQYEAVRRNDHDGLAEPIKTPTIAGGLLSIDRQWFLDIGGYDPGLDIWGTENLELSFKTWMCGGQLLIVPCSRVGHVFRDKSPYSFPGPPGSDVLTAARNNGRVADVWMDEYGQLFLRRFPYIRDLIATGSHPLSDRHQLRTALGCHSFSWYLETVYRELYRPSVSPIARGELRHIATGLCMDLDRAGRLTAFPCHGQSGTQYFQLTSDGRLEHVDFCIGVLNKSLVSAFDCQLQDNTLIITHSRSENTLMTSGGLCVTVALSTTIRLIKLTQCNSTGTVEQLRWSFSEYL